jgi:hypothetical protein
MGNVSRLAVDEAGPAALFAAFWWSLAAVLIDWSLSLVGLAPRHGASKAVARQIRSSPADPSVVSGREPAEAVNSSAAAEEELQAWKRLKEEEAELDKKYYSNRMVNNSGAVWAFDGIVQGCINVYARLSRHSIYNRNSTTNDEVCQPSSLSHC